MMGWNGDWSGSGWLGMIAMMSVMLIFWGLVIWGIVYVVRSTAQPSTPPGDRGEQRATPEEILTERFARGEIDAEEYEQRLGVLQSSPTARAGPADGFSRSAGRELLPK